MATLNLEGLNKKQIFKKCMNELKRREKARYESEPELKLYHEGKIDYNEYVKRAVAREKAEGRDDIWWYDGRYEY